MIQFNECIFSKISAFLISSIPLPIPGQDNTQTTVFDCKSYQSFVLSPPWIQFQVGGNWIPERQGCRLRTIVTLHKLRTLRPLRWPVFLPFCPTILYSHGQCPIPIECQNMVSEPTFWGSHRALKRHFCRCVSWWTPVVFSCLKLMRKAAKWTAIGSRNDANLQSLFNNAHGMMSKYDNPSEDSPSKKKH